MLNFVFMLKYLRRGNNMDFKKILFKTNSIDVEHSLPDALVFINKDGKIQWVNDIAAEIFDTSKMHLMTSNIVDFIENAMNIVSNAVIMNKPMITKFKEREFYYDMTVREIEEGYVLDFREAVETSHIIQDSADVAVINREKNNFLLKLSNDLKSPIQSIVGFSQAMADGLGGGMSEQQEKYIKIINKNSTDLMYFIGKLLELSQTESVKIQPEIKTVDIYALVNSVVKFNEQLYKGKDIKIAIKCQDDYKRTSSTDPDILKMILQDILEVIFKSVDMGEVVINLSTPNDEYISDRNLPAGSYTMLSISSSSLLLSENDLACMFDPYKILDSTNRKNVLRAIVLSSVKNMLQTLGGIIWVESQILKSTSFNVIIPEV